MYTPSSIWTDEYMEVSDVVTTIDLTSMVPPVHSRTIGPNPFSDLNNFNFAPYLGEIAFPDDARDLPAGLGVLELNACKQSRHHRGPRRASRSSMA